ncbi:hypothetical protein HNQ34_000172 [Anoxybacillus tepidamans]|uniref:Uncharacterized protein n=1 Tax=Anoxybacteroides tepidamans TaxID=265948 RepID=A0A7W8IMA3_9BACL|nr:hypothetical protein [Anoxybacillus tepidamans]
MMFPLSGNALMIRFSDEINDQANRFAQQFAC